MRAILITTILAFSLSGCLNANNFEDGELEKSINITEVNPAYKAASYLGFTEKTHRLELRNFIGVDPIRTEWCAAFVNAVLAETGIPGSESVSNYPLTARSFLSWGASVRHPQPGDVVVFPRGNEAWQGHVGFFLRSVMINDDEYYYILGGNQNNKVSIELYKAKRAIDIRRYDQL